MANVQEDESSPMWYLTQFLNDHGIAQTQNDGCTPQETTDSNAQKEIQTPKKGEKIAAGRKSEKGKEKIVKKKKVQFEQPEQCKKTVKTDDTAGTVQTKADNVEAANPSQRPMPPTSLNLEGFTTAPGSTNPESKCYKYEIMRNNYARLRHSYYHLKRRYSNLSNHVNKIRSNISHHAECGNGGGSVDSSKNEKSGRFEEWNEFDEFPQVDDAADKALNKKNEDAGVRGSRPGLGLDFCKGIKGLCLKTFVT